jgi:hypothetical protein
MKIAESARITLDPRRILSDRWAHDQAHRFVDARRRALDKTARKRRRK